MKADPWWKTRYDAMLAAPLSRLPLGVWPFCLPDNHVSQEPNRQAISAVDSM